MAIRDVVHEDPCGDCRGGGRVNGAPCKACFGSGKARQAPRQVARTAHGDQLHQVRQDGGADPAGPGRARREG